MTKSTHWGRYTVAAINRRNDAINRRNGEARSGVAMCARCGHPPDWHRLDDSTNVSPVDPRAKFRCLGYDCEAPGPVPAGGRACDCPDMVGNPLDEHTRMWAAEIGGFPSGDQ